MKPQEFTKLLDSLNPAQRQAVDTIEGAVMVIAGPGTGKTQILTLRIGNILDHTQVNPENILALTYTESGVAAMRKRLVSIAGNAGYRVDINTFHGFCNDVIRTNPEKFPKLIASGNATELDQIQIMEEFIQNAKLEYLKPFGDPTYYVRPILSAIEELKKEGVSTLKFEDGITKQEEDFWKTPDLYHPKEGRYKGKMKGEYDKKLHDLNKNKELLKAYMYYEESLIKQKLYDFNDMLLEVVEAMETNEEFLLQLQEKYQYILVDEHQDTNATQNKIVELLSNFYENPNLFVVGDEKQAIYRFQGASLENFLYFKNLYQSAVLINLSDNYRSTQTILDASSSLIKHNAQPDILSAFSNAKLHAQKNHPEEPIQIAELNDYYSEYAYVVSEISKLVESGIKPCEIAIFAKENKDLNPLASFFDQQHILYVNESTQDILDDIHIQKLISLFKCIYAIGKDEELIKAMHIDFFGVHPLDIYKVRVYAKQEKVTVWDILAKGQYETNLILMRPERIKQLYQSLLLWNTKSFNERFDVFAKSVLSESGFWKSILSRTNSMQTTGNVITLFEEITTQIEKNANFNLSDFLEFINRIKEHTIRIKSANKVVKREAVRVMTAHRSKGLEFDYVFIIGSHDGHWGNTRKRGTSFSLPWEYLTPKLLTALEEDRNEDERRLFYVALTRARKGVQVSYSTHGRDGKEQVPSQFTSEIDESFRTYVETEKFEKEFLEKKHEILFPPDISQTVKEEFLSNKDYFAEVFKKKGFAPTHLNNYLMCPWKYFFSNLIELPYTYEKGAIFGSAVHGALSTFITSAKNARTLDLLLANFTNTIQKSTLNEDEKEELLGKGKKSLEGYYSERMVNWPENIMSEFVINGIRFSKDVMLTGRIDMVWPIDNSNKVHVFDFKTGKQKSRNEIEGKTKDTDGNYKRQLVFYKLLMDLYNFKKFEMVDGVIEFVEPNDASVYKREVFIITNEEIKELKKCITEVTQEILHFEFWDKGCGKPDCEYCKLHSYMAV